MKITAVYCRVSTVDQHPEMQEKAIQDYLKTRPFQNIRWFHDVASAKGADRPGWREVLGRIDKGQVRTLVVWRLDRPARSLIEMMNLMKKLMDKDVCFISLMEHFDLKTAVGRLTYNVLCSFAEFEREVIIERVRGGVKAAMMDEYRCKACKKHYKFDCKNGDTPDICPLCGAAAVVFVNKGKRWGGRKKGHRTKATRYKIERIKELRKAGLSLRVIAQAVKLHHTSVHHIIQGDYDKI